MKLSKSNNLLAMVLLCLSLPAMMMAQVKTEKTTTQGQPTVETKVERGEVVAVSGNDVVVKMENGEIRNFSDVPETARVAVNGQQLSVHELKPGMKLERTITTTTTPQTVTTVKTVTGRVFHVAPPNTVILTLEDGTNQQFKIPSGQKFNVNGQDLDAWHLRKGMNVSATQIVTEPQTVASEERKVTGEMPPIPANSALLIVIHPPAPEKMAQAATPTTPQTAQPAEKEKLPQTASGLPLTGLIGAGVFLLGIVLFAWSRARRGWFL